MSTSTPTAVFIESADATGVPSLPKCNKYWDYIGTFDEMALTEKIGVRFDDIDSDSAFQYAKAKENLRHVFPKHRMFMDTTRHTTQHSEFLGLRCPCSRKNVAVLKLQWNAAGPDKGLHCWRKLMDNKCICITTAGELAEL